MNEKDFSRFVSKLDCSGGCWRWTAYVDRGGYGRLNVGSRTDHSRRQAMAHRLSYEHFIGEIPSGKELDHLCRNRRCVNPTHLEAVTHRENVRRGEILKHVEDMHRRKRERTHCKHGHPWVPENIYIDMCGYRKCRACHSLAMKRWYRAKSAA